MQGFSHIKKWTILFFILLFPYLVVQVVENATHNIFTLGYLEKTELVVDSLGITYEINDSLRVPIFKLLNHF